MNRLSAILLFLLCLLPLWAQDISVADFYLDEFDTTANSHGTTVNDQNGNKCALIKIITTQTGFSFDVGVLGVTDTKQHTAEIWVYVPAGVKRMTISHSQLGQLRDYYFPVQIERAKTYIMKLDTNASVMSGSYDYDHMQTLEVKVVPPKAYVSLDGSRKQTDSNGMVVFPDLYFGRHPIRITADDYYTHEDYVVINDPDKAVAIVLA